MTIHEGVEIGDRRIGAGEPVYIIAEAGVNHNGRLDMAKELVTQAKRVGADCVKFQTFQAEDVVTDDAPKADYQLRTTDSGESQKEMLSKVELPVEAYPELIGHCQDESITFLSTPYNRKDVDLLDELGIAAFKLASIHCAEPSFLRYVAGKGKPMFVSTGMATLAEVDTAVRAIRDVGNDQFIVLHCTSDYPTAPDQVNMKAMVTMREGLNVPVGYSDHTQDAVACMTAVALGATVLEKHFTLDKELPGPDQSSSSDPPEFERLVQKVRQVETVLGRERKEPTEAERTNMRGMRRSVVTRRPVAAGDTITEEDLDFKRPGTGLSPSRLDLLLGRAARYDLPADTLIDISDVE